MEVFLGSNRGSRGGVVAAAGSRPRCGAVGANSGGRCSSRRSRDGGGDNGRSKGRGSEAKATGVVVLGAAMEPVVWVTGEAVAEAEAEEEADAETEAKRAEVKVQAMVQAAEMQATINWRQMGAAVGDQNKISDPGGAVVQRSFHKTHFCAFCEVQGSRFKVQGSDT